MGDGMASSAAVAGQEPSQKDIKLVIGASSLGTVFEWYDFFIYGTLAPIIGRVFFPTGNVTLELLLSLAGFAIGFGFRPLGAVLFGYLGDKLGRKYTFLVTITLMGLGTAAIGFVPSEAAIGMAAPVIIILLRIVQGLALGGEYGGAAIYVSEHAPDEKRGFFTSFIQASVAGGFILSILVVLGTKSVISDDAWNDWGWRIPFIFSLLLLAVSLYMRLKLSESPVFKAMKEAGETSANPLKESFTYPGNKRRILVALFGLAAGLTVIWYTAMYGVLFFLTGPQRMESWIAETVVGVGAMAGLFWFVFFGWLSDRIGRKKPIVLGYAATLVLLFPLFHLIGNAANPGLAEAARRAPVVVTGSDCSYSPFAKEQDTECGKALDMLSKRGVAYKTVETPNAGPTQIRIGSALVSENTAEALEPALADAGYNLEKVRPSGQSIALIIVAILVLSALSGATYGPMAALLSELFPPRIRYSSMSIPYHIGTGYFGGFLPLVSQYIVAKTGDPYAGLWYTFAVVLMALLVTIFGLKETRWQSLDAA